MPPPERQEPVVEAAEPTTAFEGSANDWDPKLHGNRRRSTTAEQAVPWLIGIILALAGIVIVLLALIFSSPDGLVAGQPTETASPSALASTSTAASSEPSGEASGSEEPSPNPTQTPEPSYGALEMVYLGRPSGTAPIYLLRRDFAKRKDPQILAQADQGVDKFAWSPDGRVGAAVISDRAVALRPGRPARPLANRISALTFGWDAETVYAVRIERDGANDRARILEIDFVSGATKQLGKIDYRHPLTAPDPPLTEAQFIDDGGQVRIYAVADGNLVVWILGAPDPYRVDPANGDVTRIARQPTLWSPDGRLRITPHETGTKTILRLRDRNGRVISAVPVSGLVSHVRWAGSSNEIVFTLGTLSAIGGVRQNLYVWDLRDGKDPMPLTSSGAAFGADWRGVMANWAP
jgi:WD40 repeat protein